VALTNTAIKQAQPRLQAYKLFDEKGLFLSVQSSGGKLWRLKYRYNGKEKKLALGSYPDTGLRATRPRDTSSIERFVKCGPNELLDND
jgi:hypothetical protein